MPALAMATSSLPQESTQVSTINWMNAGSLESPAMAMQVPLLFWMDAAAVLHKASSTSFKITLAPSLASISQIFRPMPCPAPVTIAVLLNNKGVVSISRHVEYIFQGDADGGVVLIAFHHVAHVGPPFFHHWMMRQFIHGRFIFHPQYPKQVQGFFIKKNRII